MPYVSELGISKFSTWHCICSHFLKYLAVLDLLVILIKKRNIDHWVLLFQVSCARIRLSSSLLSIGLSGPVLWHSMRMNNWKNYHVFGYCDSIKHCEISKLWFPFLVFISLRISERQFANILAGSQPHWRSRTWSFLTQIGSWIWVNA